MTTLKDDTISIRHYEPQDEDQVKALFAAGMMSLVDDAFWCMIRHPPNLGILFAVGAVSFRLAGKALVSFLATCSTAGFYYMTNRHFFRRYVAHSQSDDLSNIPKVYVDSGGCFLVAIDEAKGKIVGTVGLEGKGPNEYELRRMSVDLSCHGKGIGTRLLQRLEKECQAGKIFLGTSNVQYAARALYQKNGYTVTKKFPMMTQGFRRHFYNFELYIFEKRLTEKTKGD